jgi:hypothetical protein
VIDATLEGSTYTLRLEGRRGRSYEIRLLGTLALSVQGATRIGPRDSATGGAGGDLLRIDMPPADPATSGAVLKRSDWATVTVRVTLRQP